jgi:FkbM family methyltransferase
MKAFFDLSAKPIQDYWNILSDISEFHIKQQKDNKIIKLNLPPERLLYYIEMYAGGMKIEELNLQKQLVTWRYQNILITSRWEKPHDNNTIKQIFIDKMIGERFENMRIIDIGAYIGDTALLFIRGGAKEVCAVEPSPANLELLKINIEQNHFSDKVHLFPVAISDQDGTMRFAIDEENPDTHHLSALSESIIPLQGRWRNIRTVEVTAWTFERLLRELGWETIDFVKVDCEGGEYPLFLQTSPELLRKVKTYYVEYHNGIEILEKRLCEIGYHLKKTPNTITPFPQMGMFYAYRED